MSDSELLSWLGPAMFLAALAAMVVWMYVLGRKLIEDEKQAHRK